VKKSTKKFLIILFNVLAVLGVISYSLADRYLIRHVEVADVAAVSAAADPAVVTTNEQTVAETPTPLEAEIQEISFDDWNYSDGSISISISQHSSGSGRNALTYFIADVVVSDATLLSNAFADNQYGRNIIENTSTIAEENDAIFAVNGDYYGFRDDGIIIRNGVIYRDVPARTGLAFYLDGTMKIYDETQTSAKELLDEGVWNTLSFGPALVEDSVAASNFDVVTIDNNFGNHPISGKQPRTGVGMIDANHFVFIVVDGRSDGYSNGVSLDDFAQMFADLGCTQAYNIDGGGSSTMYFMGRVVNNPLGRNRERGTSDILMIS